jgi:RNA polymerase sigma factor (sigma-70 family)
MTAGLGNVAARGGGITLMSQGIRFALQLGSLIVLARLLSPQEFGVVAMVTAITNVMEIVRDFGLSSAAMQAKELNDAERTNLFWVNTGIGTGCALVVTLSAPLIVRIYGTSVVGPIVLALGWLFIVSGVNTQFRAELSRSLRFKALAVTDIAAQAGSIAVAISLAAAGAGYWAVVGQQITLVVLTCASNVILCKWRPGLPRRSVSIRRFFRFGGSVLGTNVIAYATNNLDNVAIGIYWGSGPLGLYSRAYQLLMVPLQQVSAPLTRVVLPVLSRVQDDDETYARYVSKAQLVGCYMLASGFAVAAGVSVPLVALLFGPKWSGVAPIFAALAIGGIFRGIGQISYWMYLSRGRADAQLKLYLVTRPIMIGLMIAGLPWGPVGVAIGHSIGFFLFWIISLWTAGRCVRTSVRPLFTQATRTLLLISGPAGALAYIGSVLVQPAAASLCLGVALGVGYLALVALISPAERANLHLMIRVLLGRRSTGRVLGPNHSDALLGTFAAITAPAAVPLLERTSADPKRILRFDPPGIQTSRKNLAEAHPAVDRVADAIPPPEQTLVVRKSRPPDGAAGQKGPADFRRPPVAPARRTLPAGFCQPPAAPARQPLPTSVARPPVKLTDHSSTSGTPEPPRKDGQSDREIVAAITAGDPAAIAMAYDRYAEALYGYSHWILHDSAAATGALKDAFVIAVAAMLSNLSEPSKLRPWLFALARNECRRRIRPASAVRYGEADAADEPADATGELADAGDELSDATVQFPVISLLADPIMPFRVIGQPTYGPGRVNGDQGQAELRSLLHSILVALKPREREVIELSFRHDLNDNDLAIVLGVSQSRAHDLATRARGRLEEALGALHIALTGREACPVLGELLTDWDGQLTEQTRDLVVRHIGECQTCAQRGWRPMRPAAFFRLLPLAPLPQELREQVLSLCTSTAEDAVAYRRR